MSMPDTAEYWWDVKNRLSYTGIDYYHIPSFDCGHRHIYEAKYIDEVNCKSCKKALLSGIEHNLKSAEQHEVDIAKTVENKLRKRRINLIKKYPNNPICTCGFPMIQKLNRSTNDKFWGCSQFPDCKITKSIIK